MSAKSVAWLEAQALAFGTDDQRDRWNAKMLPEEELLAIARTVLFKPLEHVPRWKRIETGELRHLTHLRLGCNARSVEFSTTPSPSEMDAQQWAVLNRIKRATETMNRHDWLRMAQATCELETTEHVARCNLCKATVSRLSASVRVPWAGRTLAREYAL